MSITIPTETDIDGSTFYQINIKLPLRSYSIKKRYSDFDNLVSTLCHQIGINHKDFPYALPPKKLTWLVKRSVIEERKKGLARFLNSLISDSSLRNEPEVLSFLQLPKNFKFQQKPEIRDENWHEMYRKVKNELNQESKVLDAEVNVNTVRLRERVRNDYEPQIDDLQKSAEAGQDNDEKVKKLQLVVQLQNTLYQLQSRPRPSPWQDSKGGNRRTKN
ncbi:uncharacterized protein LODBEIA_P43220 [Lodderomyces beijingensis]|uniref:PX domain-containing protein n=1 Tax=Lodderomyces beijingensis TaxID=1775926 RepID=A0ABP0ZQZ0_9ASCO